ncbi:MAG: acyl carrier protein [Bacteroidales bacterium]|nr:acyl carrier protein [Bacteroidales bacterium]
MDTDLQKIIDFRESTTHEVMEMLITALHLNIQPGDLDPDTPLFGSGLGLDSVDAVMIVVELESRYNLSISEEEAMRAMRTVNSIIDLVISKKNICG